MIVQILVDNINSWVMPYALELEKDIRGNGIHCKLIHKHSEIEKGDVLVLLSCEELLKNLKLNTHNLVAHASDLPKGRGWSPLTWQILEGKNEVTVTLFEVGEKVDSGPVYFKDKVSYSGHELLGELREKLGAKCNELILKFIKEYHDLKPKEQTGEASYYKRRKPEDAEIDIDKSIREQFNLFRISDNEKYPVFFKLKGHKFILKIEKEKE